MHEYLLRHPILSTGGAFLVRPPRRTAGSTPASSSLARSPGDLRSRMPRYGIHECSGLLEDRKSTRLNSSHVRISYAVFCLKKKKKKIWHVDQLDALAVGLEDAVAPAHRV